jgi:hypothetical protein
LTDLDALADEEAERIPKGGPRCWVCSIPERAWIEKAGKEGRSLAVIVAVLVRQGHPPEIATKHRVKGHLANHVR